VTAAVKLFPLGGFGGRKSFAVFFTVCGEGLDAFASRAAF